MTKGASKSGSLLKMIIQPFDIFLFSIYFIFLFLSIFWITVLFTVKDEKKPALRNDLPMFTAIVPAYNEEKTIRKTIESLVALDYPLEKKQIIVVNDGSKDKTRDIVETFIAQHAQGSIILINQENKGKAAALNAGLAVATGEFFACLDADSFIEPNALKEMLPYFEQWDVAAVCPLLKVHNPQTVIEKVQWYEYVINMLYKSLNGKLDCIHVTPGPFSVYRTNVITSLGGYDEDNITEDLEIAIRLQKHHYKIIQTFDATVYTSSPKTWRKLFTQRVRWYKGSVENSLKYKEMIFNKSYGDFGMIRMPTIILSGVLSIIVFLFIFQDLLIRSVKNIRWLYEINFNIIPVILNYQPQIDILTLPYAKYFIALTSFVMAIFVMIYAYKTIGERITNHGKTFVSLTFYLFVYSIFLSTVWLYIAYQMVTKRKTQW